MSAGRVNVRLKVKITKKNNNNINLIRDTNGLKKSNPNTTHLDMSQHKYDPKLTITRN